MSFTTTTEADRHRERWRRIALPLLVFSGVCVIGSALVPNVNVAYFGLLFGGVGFSAFFAAVGEAYAARLWVLGYQRGMYARGTADDPRQ